MNSEIMQEEIFGPILPIVVYKSFDEVIHKINNMGKPLAIYYMGNSKDLNFQRVLNETSSGNVSCNEVIMHVSIHEMAFGGVGTSGYGRYGGFEGFKQLSNRKGILIKSIASKNVLKMGMPPFDG